MTPASISKHGYHEYNLARLYMSRQNLEVGESSIVYVRWMILGGPRALPRPLALTGLGRDIRARKCGRDRLVWWSLGSVLK